MVITKIFYPWEWPTRCENCGTKLNTSNLYILWNESNWQQFVMFDWKLQWGICEKCAKISIDEIKQEEKRVDNLVSNKLRNMTRKEKMEFIWEED